MPCCSTRADVAHEYPEQANAEQSGWGLVYNYGNLPEGRAHGHAAPDDRGRTGDCPGHAHRLTVSRLGGYAFIDRFDLSAATAEIVGEARSS